MTAPWLVVRGGALGDFILTIPVIEALVRAVGVVDLFASPRFARLRPDLTRRVVDLHGLEAMWLHRPGPLPAPYTHALVFTPGVAARLRQAGVQVLEGPAQPPPGAHATDAMAAALAPLGLPPVERPRIDLARPGPRQDLVVLAPGASSPAKVWGGFAALSAALRAQQVPVEVIAGLHEPLPAGLEPAPRGPPLELDALAHRAAHCSVWLGNDTGTTHLAAAAGARVLALFGPTDPRCWAPRGAHVMPLSASVDAVLHAVQALRAGAEP